MVYDVIEKPVAAAEGVNIVVAVASGARVTK